MVKQEDFLMLLIYHLRFRELTINNIKVKFSQFGGQVPDVFKHVLHR